MRDGTLDDSDVALLESQFEENLTDEELLKFKHALHLCPTWKIANAIVFDYLKDDMITPIAKVRAWMTSKKRQNCCMKECNFPQLNALCVGAKVMLLKKYAVELGLFNGAVGTLKSLHFESSKGPDADELKGYAIVDFPKSTILEHTKLLPLMPSTCVPVPTV